MVTNSDDWVGGWGSTPDAGGSPLPPNRKAALALCCPECGSTALRVRSSEKDSPVAWLECVCAHRWKEAVARFERALIAR